MCLGGHLAYRCALDKRVAAAVCYFATDIHSNSLGEGKKDDSLERAGDIKGELVMVCVWLFKDCGEARAVGRGLTFSRVRFLERRIIMFRPREGT